MSTKEDIKRKKCNDEKKDYNEKTGRCIKKKNKIKLVIKDVEESKEVLEEVKADLGEAKADLDVEEAKADVKDSTIEKKSKINKSKKLKTKLKLKINSSNAEELQEKLKEDYLQISEENIDYQEKIKDFEIKKEIIENLYSKENQEFNYLYPTLDDPNFNIKIAEKKEFYDTQYDGTVRDEDGKNIDIEEQAEKLCNAEFELSPNQLFVRNFLSFQTPYNSLLLYHGLGSGKTCSAISVAEEMRDYLKQMGILQRIIVVASPNVQDNFKVQLFNETKLKNIDGLWDIRACTGNKFLKEINPMNMKGLSREKIVKQVNKIINDSYLFLGYIEFANYIDKISRVEGDMDERKREIISRNKLNKNFNNRLVIIDEIHNVKVSDENKDKRAASELMKLVKNVTGMRLLLLSATPMYNSYKEIIWLINLMNINDKRAPMEIRDVFTSDGSFKTDETGREIGRELLERKATGYISFVRGENPYTFPYRIWPAIFSPEHSILSKGFDFQYPLVQLNEKAVAEGIEIIDLYMTKIGKYQGQAYEYIINEMKGEDPKTITTKKGINRQMPTFENMESFGYTMLQRPIQALNIVYPNERLDKYIEGEEVSVNVSELVGTEGLDRIMKYIEERIEGGNMKKKDFEYKKNTKPEDRIFSPSQIGKYSSKIKSICDNILNSSGIILIYSEYIDGGLIPVALALEELGFTRYGEQDSLFKNPPTSPIDSNTYEPRTRNNENAFNSAKYTMITGDKRYSPNNMKELKDLNREENKNGEKIKVVLISKAGYEGLDFKNIRQVHVMEPWYNMNRIEQIIGRAVRNCSHKELRFSQRNVLIYLYGTILENVEVEAADLYIYRLAEKKSKEIGVISRLLKEISIDCLLNYEQINFTVENINQRVRQNLSNGKTLNYQVGDRPYTAICDYMEKCQYKCRPSHKLTKPKLDTFNEGFIFMNTDKIIQRIRNIFKERHFFSKEELIMRINLIKEYPLVQINAALNQLVEDKNEYISDAFGRIGNLINIGDLYLFQPIELTNKNISLYDRSVPLQFKHEDLKFILPENLTEAIIEEKPKKMKGINKQKTQELIDRINTDYENATTEQILLKGEKDWYKQCNAVMIEMESEGVSREILTQLLINHIAEMLIYDDTLLLINYLYEEKDEELEEPFNMLKEYYIKHTLKSDDISGLLLQKHQPDKKQDVQLVIYNEEEKTWRPAEYTDETELQSEIAKLIPTRRFNNIIGFIGNIKNNYMIFKTKDMNAPRNTGARCHQSGKPQAVKRLNEILGRTAFNNENTKKLHILNLCIRQEFTLRLFNMNKRDKKIWFLNPTESALSFGRDEEE